MWRGGEEGNTRETTALEEFPFPSLSFSLFLSTYLARPRSVSSPACTGERLPILRQGQDRDFNQLAGFLGPGK